MHAGIGVCTGEVLGPTSGAASQGLSSLCCEIRALT